jgi:enoyl-CoA hydratase
VTDRPADAAEPVVVVRRDGRVGHLVLNRPRAINALTLEMVRILQRTLDAWAADDAVEVVVLTGAGERGLCAGGDIVALWEDARTGDGRASATFWAEEYRLDNTIKHYPKPYVAVMDGIVLGGGIGVSAHGGVRVVTERSSIGMPETGIGFLPDVGGTWLLSRAPGETGTRLATIAETSSPA